MKSGREKGEEEEREVGEREKERRGEVAREERRGERKKERGEERQCEGQRVRERERDRGRGRGRGREPLYRNNYRSINKCKSCLVRVTLFQPHSEQDKSKLCGRTIAFGRLRSKEPYFTQKNTQL